MYLLRLVCCTAGIWILSTTTVFSDNEAKSIIAQESQLRAAVILGVMRFSTWPNKDPKEKSLNICTVGKPLSESSLFPISNSPEVYSKSLDIRVLPTSNGYNFVACDVVVCGPGIIRNEFTSGIKNSGSRPLLIICDGCNTQNTKAAITLIQRNNKIGFIINLKNANDSGIKFGSSLLELATELRK